MSSVKIQGSATGTANFTIAVPDGTSTDRTINLPDAAGSFVLADASGNVDITGTVTADRLTADASGEAILSLNGYTASQDTEVQLVAVRDDVSTSKSLLDIKTNDGSSLVRRIRIDSLGNLLVGKSSISTATVGAELRSTGALISVADGTNPVLLNRLTSDGDIAVFRKDSTAVGVIGNLGAYMYLASKGAGSRGVKITDNFIPADTSGNNNDNAMDLGGASVRWDDVYATNGTIQTSDVNEKQDVAELDEAEKRVATAAKGLIRKFRWISSVEEKGDDARIHVGVIAQDLKAAFEAEGLDPGRYAMFISSTWWEADETYTDDEGVEKTRTNTYETAEEAPEGAVERTRLGVRYNQLLAFIIGAI